MSDNPPELLSSKQKEAWLRLHDATYTKKDKPSQAVVTQIFKKLFNEAPDKTFIENLQYVFAYQKITSQKEKDVYAIKNDMIKKISGKQDKARLRKILNENRMDMLREEVNDLESKNMEYQNTLKDDDEEKKEETPRPSAPPAPSVAPSAPPAGMTAEDYAVMKQMADMRAESRAEEKNMEDEEGNVSISSLLNRYINKKSDFYENNKKEVNAVLKIFANEKNIQDGSWLTKLADLEFPGIEVFQKIIKNVGLGFSDQDNEDFMKMLSRDPDERNSVPNDRATALIFKMFVNPDAIGKMVQTRIGQAGDDIKAWWKKLIGERADLKPKDQEVADKIEERRKANEKKRERDANIDEWMGDKKEEEDPTAPTKTGTSAAETDNAFLVDGDRFDPNNLSYEQAYNIMIPPNLRQYGYQETTAGQDFARWAWGFITGGAYRNVGEKDFLTTLAHEHPQMYLEYQEQLAKYKKVVGKAGKERDSLVDYEVSQDYINGAKNLTEDLIKKGIASGKIDRAAAEKLYDAWDIMNGFEDGSAKMTYAQFEELQKNLYNALPREVITDNSDAINEFMTNYADSISATWDGDSDLGDFEWLKDILDPSRTAEKDGTPKEKTIAPFKPKGTEPKYRWRGKWGDTDKVFEKMQDDVEKRNLVIEVQRLRESIDTTNKLVQSQLLTDKMRFDDTFAMPPPQPSKYYPLPNEFKKEHRAIFTPAVIQNPMRDFERNTRDAEYFGQYQGFHPAVMPTSARRDLLTNPLVYPSNADLATGGELQEVGRQTLFDLIKERRF